MLNTLLSVDIAFIATSGALKMMGASPSDWRIIPTGPCPCWDSALTKILGFPKNGMPAPSVRMRFVIMMNFPASIGSLHTLAVVLPPQMSARSVAAFAVLTFTFAVPHTVTLRFLASAGSGRGQEAQRDR